MPNPFNVVNNVAGANNPMGNMSQFMQRLNEFKSTIQGDPREQVQQLLNSGRMSQNQLSQLQEQAKKIMQFLPK